MLREVREYARMAAGVCDLVRAPVPAGLGDRIRKQLQNRESIFLDLARRIVFENQRNPYHAMFRHAGCGFNDLEESVRRDGLEATLAALHRQGVYLAHDEFKGRQPIVRSGNHIASDASSFFNPLAAGKLETQSSGSRSKGTRTSQNTEFNVHKEAHNLLKRREFGFEGRVQIELKPVLPSASGLLPNLRSARYGYRIDRWFAPEGSVRHSAHYRAMTAAMVTLGNAMGARARYPAYLPPNDFSPVAEWIARRRTQGLPAVVKSFTSPAVRVAAAAIEKNLDIRGTIFLSGGEALTPAKYAVVHAAGAEIFSNYGINEVGPIGHGCRQMRDGNCVHVYRDSVAVVSYRRRAPLSEADVDSLLLTNLLASAPCFFINVEMDDTGTLGKASCDCVFSQTGFTEQIREVASFGKLTGLGITLVGTDVVRILEEALPRHFGGGPGDYQLVEGDGAAQTHIMLRVSPRVKAADAGRIKTCFLNEAAKCFGGTLAARLWEHAEAVDVVLAEPFTTRTGKVLPLHLQGAGAGGGMNGAGGGMNGAGGMNHRSPHES